MVCGRYGYTMGTDVVVEIRYSGRIHYDSPILASCQRCHGLERRLSTQYLQGHEGGGMGTNLEVW